MENCYERILELLGTHKDDPVFAKFVEDLGETPNVFLDSRHSTEFMFEQSGFTLSFMKKPNCFTYAFLYGKRHKYQPFLPAVACFCSWQ
jgi:hypothetical protein